MDQPVLTFLFRSVYLLGIRQHVPRREPLPQLHSVCSWHRCDEAGLPEGFAVQHRPVRVRLAVQNVLQEGLLRRAVCDDSFDVRSLIVLVLTSRQIVPLKVGDM